MTFLDYLREEWRLMRLRHWGAEYHAANRACTKDDPRCAALLARLQEARERMDRLHIPRMLKGKALNMHATDVQQTFDAMARLKTGAVRKVK